MGIDGVNGYTPRGTRLWIQDIDLSVGELTHYVTEGVLE